MKYDWLFVWCIVGLVSVRLIAQGTQLQVDKKIPLGDMLNKNGTLDLKSGFSGSLDPQGWRMLKGANGEPRFLPVAPQKSQDLNITDAEGDENWDGGFGVPGTFPYNAVVSLAISGNDLYAGIGDTSQMPPSGASAVAKWDGNNWLSLGSGIPGHAFSLAISGSDLYTGGFFWTEEIGVPLPFSFIGKWDGSGWLPLGVGVNGPVGAIAVNGNEVYVGGQFTMAGETKTHNIAKWYGNSWWNLGNGVGSGEWWDWVHALAVNETGEVYAGGYFSGAVGHAPYSIAKWDGSSWSELEEGITGVVRAIAVNGSDVYVGGQFTMAGETGVNYIAKWDGSNWLALPNESVNGMNGTVWALAVSGNGDVYAGGEFTTAGEKNTNHIARWDGSSWSALGSGVDSTVYALAVSGSDLYVGGCFTTAGNKPSYFIGRYSLKSFPTANAGGPYEAQEGGTVIVTASGTDPEGGPLTYAWDLNNDGIFEKQGQSVDFYATSLDGPASLTINVQVTNNQGLKATDQAIVKVDNVFPAATFTNTSGAIIVEQSAILSFNNQFDPSTADMAAGFVYSYDYTDDGTFEVEDDSAATYNCMYQESGPFIARGRIKDKDGGFTDYTAAVLVQTPMQAALDIKEQVYNLERYGILNEGQVKALTTLLDKTIQQMNSGSLSKVMIQQSNTGKTNAAIKHLQAFINQINAFIKARVLTVAQGQPLKDAANRIITALRSGSCFGKEMVSAAVPTEFGMDQNYPNPFNPQTTIRFRLPERVQVILKVYDIQGKEVITLANEIMEAGEKSITFDTSHLPSGVYFYRLQAGKYQDAKKMTLIK